MGKPFVVIVGRPNVGKSTLFNRIARSQAAIVEDIAGVTRDRNYLDAEWSGKDFVVVDTGGFYPEAPDDIFSQVREQALFAVEEGDIIIHLLDGKDGLTPADMELARLLRRSGKKILWAVNKIDAPSRDDRMFDFYAIGTHELFSVSAATGYGYDDLMDTVSTLLPPSFDEKIIYPRIAVVGKPNVGKSTLINTLLSKKRMIVSPTPGTTRDSIDSICTYYGRKYLFIDTAGIRRKDRIGYSIDRFSMVRSIRSIERCDIALIVLDAGEGITEQDQKIAGIVDSYGKGAVFLINKWDLVSAPEEAYRMFGRELNRKIWFMPYAPFLTISALDKTRVTKIFTIIDQIMTVRKKRIPTVALNKAFREMVSAMSLPSYHGKPLKLHYITQVKTEPPSFVAFTNYPRAFKDAYVKHMEKIVRKSFPFTGTPIRIYIKEKERTDS